MKLLLTSAGLTNGSIVDALGDLAGKPFHKLSVAFIPTAANTLSEDKGWLLTEMQECYKLGLQFFDIVDVAALPKELILQRLSPADILVFSGGDTYPLLQEIQQKNIKTLLSELLKEKIYVGISAGSMITAPTMTFQMDAEIYEEGEYVHDVDEGLDYVPFHIKPHFLSSYFPKVTASNVKKIRQTVQQPIYLLDDQSAVVVDGENVKVISEGVWKKFE